MIMASFIDSASLRSFFNSDSSMDNLAAITAANFLPSHYLPKGKQLRVQFLTMNTKTQQAVDFVESNGQLSPIFELLVRGYSSTLIISFKGCWFFYFCCTFWIPWYPIVVSHLRPVYTDS